MKKRILALLLTLALCLPLLVGCHGARRMDPFEIPETFDTTREHTITFWAKSDTTSSRPTSTKKPLPISRHSIPIFTLS